MACGLRAIIALSAGPCLSYAAIRARYISTSCRDVTVPACIAACNSGIVFSMMSTDWACGAGAARRQIKSTIPAIRVICAPENCELARHTLPWISGVAVGESSLIVIVPSRSPAYPDNTIEDVVRHEVAHVLILRATGGYAIPRWFNEGLAMEVE